MMKSVAASVRGRHDSSSLGLSAFLRSAQVVAIRRAARDAHRSVCDYDAVECSICREHARAIAAAKVALNQVQPLYDFP